MDKIQEMLDATEENFEVTQNFLRVMHKDHQHGYSITYAERQRINI